MWSVYSYNGSSVTIFVFATSQVHIFFKDSIIFLYTQLKNTTLLINSLVLSYFIPHPFPWHCFYDLFSLDYFERLSHLAA